MPPSSNPIHVRSYACSKSGQRPEESQDGISPLPGSPPVCTREDDGTTLTFLAVADGATESYLPQIWAMILAQKFPELKRDGCHHSGWTEWISDCRKEWLERANLRRNNLPKQNLSFADIVNLNSTEARLPAAATFAGLRLRQSPQGETAWDALVLGDSCLFHLRHDRRTLTAPYSRSEEFTYTPNATLSYPSDSSKDASPVKMGDGQGHYNSAMPGDVFVLATDAMAKWIITSLEKNTPVWGTLLRQDLDFNSLVEQARKDAVLSMENDDVSLVIAMVGLPHPWCLEGTFTPQPKASRPVLPAPVAEPVNSFPPASADSRSPISPPLPPHTGSVIVPRNPPAPAPALSRNPPDGPSPPPTPAPPSSPPLGATRGTNLTQASTPAQRPWYGSTTTLVLIVGSVCSIVCFVISAMITSYFGKERETNLQAELDAAQRETVKLQSDLKHLVQQHDAEIASLIKKQGMPSAPPESDAGAGHEPRKSGGEAPVMDKGHFIRETNTLPAHSLHPTIGVDSPVMPGLGASINNLIPAGPIPDITRTTSPQPQPAPDGSTKQDDLAPSDAKSE
ncbi:hypothetical protein [Verrucomicrobium spinosum]|uniref:hypothetical protein n=2 Tax=Verrucomicrobium spinosum TaxID=2736 RepID=UPI0012F67C34|nr:hypothetical protein [Verrucomicrobium spinosum]